MNPDANESDGQSIESYTPPSTTSGIVIGVVALLTLVLGGLAFRAWKQRGRQGRRDAEDFTGVHTLLTGGGKRFNLETMTYGNNATRAS